MFYFPLAELGSGSSLTPPEAPVCSCPGVASRGSQENPIQTLQLDRSSGEAQVSSSSFKIHRTKCTVKTAECEVQVSGKPNRIHPVSHQQLVIKHLLPASLDPHIEKFLASNVRVDDLGELMRGGPGTRNTGKRHDRFPGHREWEAQKNRV